ncbi:MAG: hypothetical protein JSW47_22895 [Phycisphaerales bacterium]|nr:MAG: hypothetical protein JSW47_22895 [Phycisphaerales bacterium]
MQHLWLSLKKEKESQEKNNKKENQEEKEIACPRMLLAGVNWCGFISNAAANRSREYTVLIYPLAPLLREIGAMRHEIAVKTYDKIAMRYRGALATLNFERKYKC